MSELQNYSGWIVAALVGVIAILVAVLKRRPVVVQPAPSPVQKQQDEVIQQVEKDAGQARDAEKGQAQKDHDDAMAVVIDTQKKQADEVKDDPQAVNDILKDVGGKVR